MTRDDFINNVTGWEDLIEFCNEHGYDGFVEDIFCDYDLNETVENDISDFLCNSYWYDMPDLKEIDRSADVYRRDGVLEYYPLDWDDFDEIKERVLESADDDGNVWEEPEVEDVRPEETELVIEDVVEDSEELQLDEMITPEDVEEINGVYRHMVEASEAEEERKRLEREEVLRLYNEEILRKEAEEKERELRELKAVEESGSLFESFIDEYVI